MFLSIFFHFFHRREAVSVPYLSVGSLHIDVSCNLVIYWHVVSNYETGSKG